MNENLTIVRAIPVCDAVFPASVSWSGFLVGELINEYPEATICF